MNRAHALVCGLLVATLVSGLSLHAHARTASAQVIGQAGTGMALRDGAVLSTIDLGIMARKGRFSGGLRLPVQLEFAHLSPTAEKSSLLRARDWDQRSEWLRLLDHAAWRWSDRDNREASAVIAPLHGATLGHGTILHRYHATLRFDRFKAGARTRWDLHSWGGDLLTDDVTSGKMVGGRVFVRPFAQRHHKRDKISRTVTIGASAVVDRSAPLGAILADNADPNSRSWDATGTLLARRGIVGVGGLDFAMELIRTSRWSLTPFMDLHFSQIGPTSGISAHAGASISRFFKRPDRSTSLRYVFSAFDGAALPAYFDTAYEVEQDLWLGAGQRKTKAEAVAFGAAGVVQSHTIEWTARLAQLHWTALVRLHDRLAMDSAAVWLDWRWSATGHVRLMALKHRFSGLSAALREGRWTTAATVRGQLVAPFAVYATAQNAWRAGTGSDHSLRQSVDVIAGLSLTNVL